MIVVSTGWKPPTKRLCLASVANQTVKCEHRYIDASEQAIPLTATENVYNLVKELNPEEVVVWVDLDDWLAHRKVLEKVQALHDEGAWVTYGSFVTSDGMKPDWQRAYTENDFRHAKEGSVTHLRTFRAGLLQRVTPEDLKVNGEWPSLCVDLSIMFPILEQAGIDRCVFVPEVLCIYYYNNSFQARATEQDRAREMQVENLVRAKRPFKRIGSL